MKNKGLLRLLYIRCNIAYTTCQQYQNSLQVRRNSLEIKKSTKTALFQSLLTLSILHGLALKVTTTKREAMFSRRRCQQNAILLLACVALFVLFKWLFVSKIFGKNEKCLVYSPAYPSAGGPGCGPRCVEKEGKKTALYGAVFHGDSHQTWPKDLVENMKLAATILKKHGQPKTLNTEGRLVLHLAFDYYCCYTEEEWIKIGNFLNTYSWEPHEVWFDKIECAIHRYNDAVSLVLMVDKKSQEDLTRWALKNERDLEIRTGVRKHIPHTRLQNFHMTLATVNQSYFPVQSAVEEINRVIPPGKWHKTPVMLRQPVCHRCERLMKPV